MRACSRHTIEKYITLCKLNVVFRSSCKLGNLFRFKDSLDTKNLSGIVYRCTYSNCKESYWKMFQDFFFFTRASYHMWISNLIEKRIKNAKKSTISDYLLQGDSPQTFDNFDILGSDSNKFKFLIKEVYLSNVISQVWIIQQNRIR